MHLIKGERRSASAEEEVMFTKHSRVDLFAPICSQPILNLTYRDNWGQMTDEGSCKCSTWTTYSDECLSKVLLVFFFFSVAWGYHRQGSCQAGMSAVVSKVS